MRLPILVPLVLLSACSSEHDIIAHPPVEDGTSPTSTSSDPTEQANPAEPIADAGPDLEASPLDTVKLDGRGSHDPNGESIVAMKWELVSAPAGSTASLDDATSPRPAFFADLAGDYVFELTVQNESGLWDSTPDEIVVTALPLDGFYVELSWDNDNDLDLHLSQGGAAFYSNRDVSWCNPNPNWGSNGPEDDPSLDWDAIYGWGPETITIEEPWDGVYNVRVHYYGENELTSCQGPCAVSVATVNIYLGGVLVETFSREMNDAGQVWNVADIHWPDYTVDFVDTVERSSKTGC